MTFRKSLRDKQELHYMEMGPPDGIPVLFFHGFPGSSTQGLMMQNQAVSHRLNVLSVERPGYGQSTHSAGSGYHPFFEHVLELLELHEAHGWKNFHVLGLSGGAPYARAMALHQPNRVLSCICVGGLGLFEGEALAEMAPFERSMLVLLRRSPRIAKRLLLKSLVRMLPPDELIRRVYAQSPPADREQLDRPEYRKILRDSFIIGLKQGERGLLFDLLNYLNHGAHTLGEFRCPVVLYHGDQDAVVPLSMSRAMAKAIEHAELVVFEGEGHYSVPVRHADKFAEMIVKLHS